MQYDATIDLEPLFGNDEDWIIEGGAEWAAHHVKDVSWNDGAGSMITYLTSPEVPLFQRIYDGMGFFGHAEDVTGDLWPHMLKILRAPNNNAAFAAAGGDDEQFLTSWASSTFNLQPFGTDWHPVSPIAPLTDIAALALTGGPQGTNGLEELESLDTYCHEQQDPPQGPAGPPIGFLYGNWYEWDNADGCGTTG